MSYEDALEFLDEEDDIQDKEDIEGEERFFGLITDHHPKYEETKKWIVVSDNGVGWRASTKFHDRAAGKGPAMGETIESPSVS